MNDRVLLGFAATLFVGLGILFFIEVTTGGILKTKTPRPENDFQKRIMETVDMFSNKKEVSTMCGSVALECVAQAEREIPGCSPETASRQLTSELSSPLSKSGCENVEARLAERCPQDCPLDTASLLVVSGKLELSAQPKKEDGSCAVVGEKYVTVRGTCMTNVP